MRWALVVLLTGAGLSMLKASSTVIVLGCLGMALLGGIVSVRARRISRPRTAADAAGELAADAAAEPASVSSGS
ncbi:hypothetical protein ABZ357_10580 [Streptomyces sp. NPDC005917]|uniref:hypothetical protein n=1 Tax=unclassified Streptomyces TaxID=2593676 RepID=UPI0033D0D1AE